MENFKIMSNTHLHKEIRKFKKGLLDGLEISDKTNNHFKRSNNKAFFKYRKIEVKDKNYEKYKKYNLADVLE